MIKFWNKPCYQFSIEQAISAGYLCDYNIFSSENKFDTSIVKKKKREYTEKEILSIVKNGKAHNQVKEIIELTKKRKRIAILCANIAHAEKIKALVDETEPCAIIHSKLKDGRGDLAKWKKSDVRFSVSVAMLSEGFDFPEIDCVVLLRPMRSVRLMIQSSGRGLRLFEGKRNCLLLDFGDVFITCGTPKNPIYEFEKKTATESDGVIIRECQFCKFIWDTKDPTCPSCGQLQKIIDVEKSLNESLFDNNVFTITLDSRDFVSAEYTGNRNCVYEYQGEKYYFYGGHYFKAIKKKPMMVTYRKKKGGFPRILKISVLE